MAVQTRRLGVQLAEGGCVDFNFISIARHSKMSSGTVLASGTGSVLAVSQSGVETSVKGQVQLVAVIGPPERVLVICETFCYPLVGQPVLEASPGTFLLPVDATTHYVLMLTPGDADVLRPFFQRACDLRQRWQSSSAATVSKAAAAAQAESADAPSGSWSSWIPAGVGQYLTPETGAAVAGAITTGGRLGRSALVTASQYAGVGVVWCVSVDGYASLCPSLAPPSSRAAEALKPYLPASAPADGAPLAVAISGPSGDVPTAKVLASGPVGGAASSEAPPCASGHSGT